MLWTCIVAFLFILLLAVLFAFLTAPDVTELRKRNPKDTAMMQFREAQAKQKGLRIVPMKIWTPLSRVSPNLIQAVLISEDDKFYLHRGFDWEGIRYALEKNIRFGRIVGGGSTITQQLAKNLYLKPTRNPVRKIREAVIAVLLDRKLKKRRILELYLNVIEWGRGVYGAEAAARTYYGKSSADLNLSESIRLASVLPSPIRFRPDSDESAWMKRRRKAIAESMLMKHFIDDIQYRGILLNIDPESAPGLPDTLAVLDSLFIKTGPIETVSPLPADSATPDAIDSTSVQ